MSEHFTLSLRLSPDTLRRKLILAACVHDLILSITSQSLRPRVRAQTSTDWWIDSFDSPVQHLCYCWCYTDTSILHLTLTCEEDIEVSLWFCMENKRKVQVMIIDSEARWEKFSYPLLRQYLGMLIGITRATSVTYVSYQTAVKHE